MEPAETYRIQYVSPAIVRCDDDLFCLEYIDAQGELTFKGFEKPHASGGLLYFPDAGEWDYYFPKRKGQRNLIQSRLIEWLLNSRSFAYLAPSVADDDPYRRVHPAMRVLKPSAPVDLNREPPPHVKRGLELMRKGYEILKQKSAPPRHELMRAVELMRKGWRMAGFKVGGDEPKQ